MSNKYVGGQAVMDGVMMMSPESYAVAVRLENGDIRVRKDKLFKWPKIFKLPFFRGVVMLFYHLVIGIKALIWSANQNLEDEHGKGITGFEIFYTLLLSIIFSIAFFVVIPFFITGVTKTEGVLFNFVEGIIRLVIFLVYLYLISLMNDIKIMFQYHGAEHKAVNAFEAKVPLTPKNIQKFPKEHFRCGTSFIVVVLAISIVVFSFILSELWYIKLIGRLILIPVIAGVSYEILRLSGKFSENWLVKILAMPGIWVQKLTTNEPSDDQIRVAVAALKAAIK